MIFFTTAFSILLAGYIVICSSLSTLAFALLIGSLVIGIVYFGVQKDPLGGVYFYLLVDMLVPHSGMNVTAIWPFKDEVSIFFIPIAVKFFVMALYLMRGRYRFSGLERRDQIIVSIALVSLFVNLTYGLYTIYVGGLATAFMPDENGDMFLHGVTDWLGALLVYVSCRCFCKTRRQIDYLIWLLIVMGSLLFVELVHLKIFPGSPLSRWGFHESGRFNSIVYLAYDTVGLISVVAFAASLWGLFRRWNFAWLVPSFGFLYVALCTYQKVTLLSFIVTSCIFAATYLGRWLVMSVIMVGSFFTLIVIEQFGIEQELYAALGGGVRQADEYTSDTVYARIGLWSRGIDAAIYTFPFGSGEGLLYSFVSSRDVPQYLERYATYFDLSEAQYRKELRGMRISDVHNLFVKVIAQHGVFGLAFLALLFIQYRRAIRFCRTVSRRVADARLTLAFCHSAMFGACLFVMLESTVSCIYLFPLLFGILLSLEERLREEVQSVADNARSANQIDPDFVPAF